MVRAAVHINPVTVDQHFFSIALYMMLLAGSDLVLRNLIPTLARARWKVLHAAANLGVAGLAIKDSLATFTDPVGSCSGEMGVDYSVHPIYMVAALHLYHMTPGLGFRLGWADYFHHLLFAGTICTAGLTLNSGPIQNFIAFFICGLPGALDYIMLVLVKLGRLRPEQEKVANARINLWLRAPGLTAATFMVYVAALYGGEDSPCRSNPVLATVIALLVFFNGQYYLNVVVGNTTRKVQTYNS